MERMPETICPECKTGKHPNCNGYADMDDDGNMHPCLCTDEAHPENHLPDEADVGELAYSVESDGSVSAEGHRYVGNNDPDTIMSDIEILMDGEWSPMAPYPFIEHTKVFRFKRYFCRCGEMRKTLIGYYEHYSYAHFLGMVKQ